MESKPKSQQRLWQERMKAQGRCTKCGSDLRNECRIVQSRKSEWSVPYVHCAKCRRKDKLRYKRNTRKIALDILKQCGIVLASKDRRGVIPSKGVKNSVRTKR